MRSKEFLTCLTLILMMLLTAINVYGADESTPVDGNLAIVLTQDFSPDKVAVYKDPSILNEKNIIIKSDRLYKSGGSVHQSFREGRTTNTDIAWINSEVFVMLTGETTEYAHGILGDAIESTGFQIYRNNQLIKDLRSGGGRVFETLRPLIADLIPEYEGKEIILTSSHREDGARVDVYSQDGVLIASSKPIGRGFRWLHTLGVASFGDPSRPYLAIVKTPHIGGTLELLYWNGSILTAGPGFGGVSSHKIGSDNLNTAMLISSRETGHTRIIVPAMDFESLLVIGLKNDRLSLENRIDLPGTIATNLLFEDSESPSIWLGLSNGTLVRIFE